MSEEIENQKVIMSLIIAGGNAKGAAFLAIKAAKEKDFKEAASPAAMPKEQPS